MQRRRDRSTSLRLAASALTALCLSGCAHASQRTTTTPPTTPASETSGGVTHTQGFWTGKGGTQLYEQAWRPAETAPRATFIVMHGLLDYSARYEQLARALVANGFAVHAFDLRGHGRSAGARVAIDSFEDYIDDLDTFVKKVRAEEHDVPVFLMGHSMGGAIATLYVEERKPALAGLVLSGPALHADVIVEKIGGTKLIAALSPNAKVFDLDIEKFSRDPEVVAACKADPLVSHEPAPARTAKELLGAMKTIEAHEDDLFVPLLLLHGAADVITDPTGSRRLYERTRVSDRTLRIYPELFHDLVHEPEKGVVITDIVEWSTSHVVAIEERARAVKRAPKSAGN